MSHNTLSYIIKSRCPFLIRNMGTRSQIKSNPKLSTKKSQPSSSRYSNSNLETSLSSSKYGDMSAVSINTNMEPVSSHTSRLIEFIKSTRNGKQKKLSSTRRDQEFDTEETDDSNEQSLSRSSESSKAFRERKEFSYKENLLRGPSRGSSRQNQGYSQSRISNRHNEDYKYASERFDNGRSRNLENYDRFDNQKSYRPIDYRRRNKSTTDNDGFDGDYVYGISPVRMVLKAKQRKILELFVQEGMDVSNKKDDQAALDIINLANTLNIPIKDMSKHDLNMLTESRPHQGFIVKVSKIEFEPIKALPCEENFKCVLALDEVWDPQNFGALIRTAHFLNVDKIIVCAKNSAPPSPVVSKASSGALEVTPINSVQNLMKFIDESIKNGWQVVGLSLEGSTVSLKELPLDKPTIVILGNEGHGIRTNILNRCTHLVKLGSGTTKDIDSLNVSVTGGIVLHHIMNRQNS